MGTRAAPARIHASPSPPETYWMGCSSFLHARKLGRLRPCATRRTPAGAPPASRVDPRPPAPLSAPLRPRPPSAPDLPHPCLLTAALPVRLSFAPTLSKP